MTPEGPHLVAAPRHLMFDRDGDPLTAALVAEPRRGTLEWNADGSFYQHRPLASSVSIHVPVSAVSDGRTSSDSAMVTVRVGGRDGDTVRSAFGRRPAIRLPPQADLSGPGLDKSLDPQPRRGPGEVPWTNAGREGGRGRYPGRCGRRVAITASGRLWASRTVLRSARPSVSTSMAAYEVGSEPPVPSLPSTLAGNFLVRECRGQPVGCRHPNEFRPRGPDKARQQVGRCPNPDSPPGSPHRNLVASAQTVRRQPGARGPAAIS